MSRDETDRDPRQDPKESVGFGRTGAGFPTECSRGEGSARAYQAEATKRVSPKATPGRG